MAAEIKTPQKTDASSPLPPISSPRNYPTKAGPYNALKAHLKCIKSTTHSPRGLSPIENRDQASGELPSICSEHSDYFLKQKPGYSFSKTEKMKFDTPKIPGVGAYNVFNKPHAPKSPAFPVGSSPKEDTYWNNKMYKRSPGPVYGYTVDGEITSARMKNKGITIRPGKLVRMIHNVDATSESPSPEAYKVNSEFDRPAKGPTITPLNKKKEELKKMPAWSKLLAKNSLGPGSYSPPKSILAKNIMHSFSKDGRMWGHSKDEFPGVSPMNYSIDNYSKQSTHGTMPKFTFGTSKKIIDVSKWHSGYQ